jgi:hypothetical protein
LFQKVSPAIKAFSSPMRFCAPGTSKKPPQMSEFFSRRRDFRRDSIEHIRDTLQELAPGIQWGLIVRNRHRKSPAIKFYSAPSD